MSTSIVESPKKESLLPSTEEVLVPELKIIKNKFYLTATWKILAAKTLDEKEINRVINKISEFYQDFLGKKGTRLHSFNFELEVNKETSCFNLRVNLSSDFFIHTSALKPTSLDLDVCIGEDGPPTEEFDLSGPPQNNPGPGAGVKTEVAAQMSSITLAYASAPPQNSGSTGAGTK